MDMRSTNQWLRNHPKTTTALIMIVVLLTQMTGFAMAAGAQGGNGP